LSRGLCRKVGGGGVTTPFTRAAPSYREIQEGFGLRVLGVTHSGG